VSGDRRVDGRTWLVFSGSHTPIRPLICDDGFSSPTGVRRRRRQDLAAQAGVDRTAFYGNRPYAHLRAEFEHRLQQLQNAGQTPIRGGHRRPAGATGATPKMRNSSQYCQQ
jgi:hypothetical protein